MEHRRVRFGKSSSSAASDRASRPSGNRARASTCPRYATGSFIRALAGCPDEKSTDTTRRPAPTLRSFPELLLEGVDQQMDEMASWRVSRSRPAGVGSWGVRPSCWRRRPRLACGSPRCEHVNCSLGAAATMNAAARPPKEIAKFEIVRRLGAGGMAEVFLAKKRGAEGTFKLLVLKRILPTPLALAALPRRCSSRRRSSPRASITRTSSRSTSSTTAATRACSSRWSTSRAATSAG